MSKKLKVLFVEDTEADALRLLNELYRGDYNPVDSRVDTPNALKTALKEETWDIVISDFSMPAFTGLDALEIVKESELDLPFILVSGALSEENAVTSLRAGAHDFISKNNMARLLPAIDRELKEAEVRRAKRLAERKILEQAMLIDIAREAIIVCDLKEYIQFWNKGAEHMYGYTAEEMLGENVEKLQSTESRNLCEEIKKGVLERGEWRGESQNIGKDGSLIVVESHCTLIRDEDGNPKSILIINLDITDKKKTEENYFRAQRMESIGLLAGGIAHDMNNILSPIILSAELLKLKVKDEYSQNLLSRIDRNAQRSADLVKQVLTFARGVEDERILLQPRHLIKELVKIIKNTFPKSIDIEYKTERNLWTISGDSTQIHQVLLNLCVNARDAMPEGGTLTIEAENATLDENYASSFTEANAGSYVAITVTDTGTGISETDIEKIFDPFYTSKEVGKGTGLGLSTVETIVKNHGGFVDVESKLDAGTKFKIFLPASTSGEYTKEEVEHELPPGNGELILIVDDEAAIRQITGESLRTYGYKVLTASDGIETVALYARNMDDIRLVLIDLVMPIMDGPSTIHALARINPQVKVIAMSGQASVRYSEDAVELGAQKFLQKPYTLESLLNSIHDILHEKNV